MMSLIDLDDDQRWVPTHVNVTVLCARGLRTKGKHGSRYLYTIIQVGKEKYTTGLVEKADVPVWNEECCFELLPGILEVGGRTAYPPGSGDLVLTVMHRVLIGLDVFLGQTIIPLDTIFLDGACPREEWFKLNSKAGRKEKERGELQVTVQFTRNNMTASMFDLTIKDKPRSAFGKLKDRVTGRKRGNIESSSAIVPGRYAALSGSLGQPFGEEGGGVAESQEGEITEEKKSKMKDFFKGRLRKSSDSRSCTSLASESSVSSMASDNLGPPPSLDLLSDPPSSPIYTSKMRVDAHYGETDLAKKVLTSQHTTKILTHKRAFSDEASKITTAFPRANVAVESLKGRTMTQSKSSLCINGSHVYDSEPTTPKCSGALSSKLVLLEKCSPLSRSLQNLTKRNEDKGSFSEVRRWSFDKLKKEEREEEKDAQTSSASAQDAQTGDCSVQAGMPAVSSPEKGKKLRKTLFSTGRSDSLPAKSDLNQAGSSSEGKFRGWFGSSDTQNKPRLEVSPKVESSSDVPPSLSPCSPVPPQCSCPSSHVSPDGPSHIHLYTPSSSPTSTPLSPLNPFLPCMQRNPFFEELVEKESEKLPSVESCATFGSSPLHCTTLPAHLSTHSSDLKLSASNTVSIKRERPRPIAKQISLPALPPIAATINSSNHSATCSTSDSSREWDDSFDAFASSRLNSPKLPPEQPRTSPTLACKRSYSPVDDILCHYAQELQTSKEEPPPLPPRRLLRTSGNEVFSDGWLHRGQELAVHKEAYLLSQTGVASRQRGREGECKINSVSSDCFSSRKTSESVSVHTQQHTNNISLGFTSEERLKKFKYEPLEDETDCWGGMLFEQDLYGRICRRNYGQQRVNTYHLSLNAEEIAENRFTFKNSGSKRLLESEVSSVTSTKIPETCSPSEETEEANLCETSCLNNNISFSLTLGDLNMNLNNLDFSFIDSDGSSQSEAADTVRTTNNLDGSFPAEDPQFVIDNNDVKPVGMFTLKDTYIPAMNSSFEITVSSKKLCKVPPVCQKNSQDCRSELDNVAPNIFCKAESQGVDALMSQNASSNALESKIRRREEQIGNDDDVKKTKEDADNNGNPNSTLTKQNQTESFSGVVSARIRPKGMSRQNSSGSPNSQSRNGDQDFEQFLSLVQNISEVIEGPSSYQPTKSVLSSLQVLEQSDMLKASAINNQTQNESNTSQILLKDRVASAETPSLMSFEDFHAKVAPNCKTPSKTKIGKSLQEPEPCSPPTHSALSLSADTPAHFPFIQASVMGPNGGASSSQTVASHTPSYSTAFSPDQLLVDAWHSLLPEETQPASSLPHQESRPHPVKPLTSSQSEKKEGRSVLEKLKSTINPGRSVQQVPPEPEKTQEVSANRAAQYQHLTNMELISLLLQQEMDMQKQQVSSEQQGAQLQKCEAELRKVKAQVRDLEDYIDNLLLRIMEQTPTLLQVRSRHK